MQLYSNEQKRLGLYFHIPFCLSKCAYCDFNSAPVSNPEIISRYISALIAHMESYRAGAASYAPDTVFIGGGTPTCIPPEELFRLIRAIKKNFRLTKNVEFSIEANPATVTYPTLLRLHRLGVNRLSMGLQSAHDIELKALSRRHTRKDFERSFVPHGARRKIRQHQRRPHVRHPAPDVSVSDAHAFVSHAGRAGSHFSL